MDYKEEQRAEIEALESIYYGDLIVTATEPEHKFAIPIKSEDYDPDTDDGLLCNLNFTYTKNYPDEGPIIEISDENFEDDQMKEQLAEYLEEQVKENLGMVMIFQLVSMSQEWLNTRWDELKVRREEEKSRLEQEREEAEQKKFEGTRVTVETFMKWKVAFEDEMGITKKRENIELEGKKLTGRQLFMKDKTLNESDLQFLDDGEAVKVNESLFVDVDNLEIDSDLETGSEDEECS